jgi:hypothetical protein
MMYISREATASLNEYLESVSRALPLAPSRRVAITDRLYHRIYASCEEQAREGNRLEIDLDLVTAELATLGSPEHVAEKLAADEHDGSSESLGFESGRIHEKASAFARAAAERGEHVFRISIETAAHALDIAAQKLHEAAEKIKSKA